MFTPEQIKKLNDIKERIKNKIDIHDVMRSYAKDYDEGSFYQICPNCESYTMELYRHGSTFKCLSCREGGDLFKVIMMIKKCKFMEALRIAGKMAEIDTNIFPPKKPQKPMTAGKGFIIPTH